MKTLLFLGLLILPISAAAVDRVPVPAVFVPLLADSALCPATEAVIARLPAMQRTIEQAMKLGPQRPLRLYCFGQFSSMTYRTPVRFAVLSAESTQIMLDYLRPKLVGLEGHAPDLISRQVIAEQARAVTAWLHDTSGAYRQPPPISSAFPYVAANAGVMGVGNDDPQLVQLIHAISDRYDKELAADINAPIPSVLMDLESLRLTVMMANMVIAMRQHLCDQAVMTVDHVYEYDVDEVSGFFHIQADYYPTVPWAHLDLSQAFKVKGLSPGFKAKVADHPPKRLLP